MGDGDDPPPPSAAAGDDGALRGGEEGVACMEGKTSQVAMWVRLKGLGCDAWWWRQWWLGEGFSVLGVGEATRMLARALAFALMLFTCFALGSICSSSDVSSVGLPRLILQNARQLQERTRDAQQAAHMSSAA